MRHFMALAALTALAACATQQPAIVDIDADKVIVEQGLFADPALVPAVARDACALYDREAVPLSNRVIPGNLYTRQTVTHHLFACRPTRTP